MSDAKKLKALEAENAKLRELLAKQMMDVSAMKEMLGKISEAWCMASRRGLRHDAEGIPAAAGLRFRSRR